MVLIQRQCCQEPPIIWLKVISPRYAGSFHSLCNRTKKPEREIKNYHERLEGLFKTHQRTKEANEKLRVEMPSAVRWKQHAGYEEARETVHPICRQLWMQLLQYLCGSRQWMPSDILNRVARELCLKS